MKPFRLITQSCLILVLGIILIFPNSRTVQAVSHQVSTETTSSVNVKLEIVGQLGGNVSTVAVAGNRAYLGIGPRVFVIDLDNLESGGQLQVIGKSNVLAGVVEKIVIANGFAYVAAGPGGLRILDISSPDPIEVGSYLPADANRYISHIGDLVIIGNTAFLADTNYGMRIIDITQKNAPIQLSEFENKKGPYENGFTMGLAVAGNYAYLPQAREGGLRIVNIADKTAPYEVSYYTTTSGSANGVVVAGSYAYVSDSSAGLDVINISNPASPKKEGALNYSWTSQGRMVLVNNLLYVSIWRMGMAVVNISNPALPTKVGGQNPGGYTNDLVISESHMLIACDLIGLCILNNSNPQAPAIDGYLNFENPSGMTGLEIDGDFVYAASNFNGLRIIQAADPSNLTEIGAYPPINDSYEGWACCTAVDGTNAYLADNQGFRVIDVSNPASPNKVGEVKATSTESPTDIAVEGNWVYVTDGQLGLKIYDVSQKTNPVLQKTFSVQPQVWGVALAGDYAYVVSDQAGLRIIDVTDPAAPSEVGWTSTVTSAMDVAVSGNYAYITDQTRGLMTVDINTPQSPVLVSTIPLSGASGITLQGNLAYVAQGQNGLTVMDINQPANPRKAGSIYTPGAAINTEVKGDYIYLNDQYGGLLVIKQTLQPFYELFLPSVMRPT